MLSGLPFYDMLTKRHSIFLQLSLIPGMCRQDGKTAYVTEKIRLQQNDVRKQYLCMKIKEQGNDHMFHRILACFCLLVYALMPFSALADNSPLNQPVTTAEGYTITPVSVRVSDGTASGNEPEKGKIYFIPCFELTNGSGSDYSFMFDSNLTATQDGKDPGPANAYAVMKEIIFSQMKENGYGLLEVNSLPSGNTVIGETGWIIDADWKEVVIRYSPGAFGDAEAVFTFHPEDILQ